MQRPLGGGAAAVAPMRGRANRPWLRRIDTDVSADNYFLVRRGAGHRFYPVMGFASDDARPVVDSKALGEGFATPELALESVIDQYAEYGHAIDPECYLTSDEFAIREEAREHLTERFSAELRYLLEELTIDDIADYLARIAEDHYRDAL